MCKLNLCAKNTPKDEGDYYVALFGDVPNSSGEFMSQIIDKKSQILYSYQCDDFRELTEKLYESIKLIGNDVRCVDNPEDFDNLLAKYFAQLINEYETDEVLLFMQIVGLYFSLKTIASSN
ncbi:MAG: hypothetical protein WCJ61_16910 [Paludibacter sp.]